MNETNSTQHLRLYLVRHGEVEEAAAGKLLGQTDAELSERGLEQAHELAEALANAQLGMVYSSDLKRARMTTEIIAGRVKCKVQEDPAWREIYMGQWEGRTMRSVYQEEQALVAQLFNDPASFAYPRGESFSTFITRVRNALDQLLLVHPRGELALVTHGGVCRTIIGTVLEIPARNWLRLAQDYGCLNVIDWYDGNPLVSQLNNLAEISLTQRRQPV